MKQFSAIFGLLALLGMPSLVGETVSLVSKDGRVIEAEIISISANSVSIKRTDGKVFDVPLDRLNEESKGKVLKAIAAKNPPPPPAPLPSIPSPTSVKPPTPPAPTPSTPAPKPSLPETTMPVKSDARPVTVEKGGIVVIEANDEAMAAAVSKARSTFPQAWKQALSERAKGTSPDAFLVKAVFGPADKAPAEQLWLIPSDFDGNQLNGTLLNQPSQLPDLKQGTSVSVSLSRLSDWVALRDGKSHGAYTLRVIRSRLASTELAAYDEQLPAPLANLPE